ncbi:MAG: DUF177 domain-containing protein [Polyangiaceae bacterium]
MSTHEFEISAADLDASGKDYRFPVRQAWLRGILEGTELKAGTEDGTIEVRASKSGTDVIVHGHLKAEVVTACARCLGDAKVVVDGPLSVLMVPGKKGVKTGPKAVSTKAEPKKSADKAEKTEKKKKSRAADEEELEFSPDEADVAPYDGDTVVLDDVVKDEILLEIPMIPLCSEDCQGISRPAESLPAVEEENRIDPRLLPLLELSKKKEGKG